MFYFVWFGLGNPLPTLPTLGTPINISLMARYFIFGIR